MAVRAINASRFAEILEQWKKDCLQDNDQQSADVISDVILQLDDMPTLTPPNEPLTLDELRGMDGQPVWVKCLKPDKYTYPPVEWRILEMSFTGNFGVWNGDCALIERNYGTDWIAYRRPPEGEEDT